MKILMKPEDYKAIVSHARAGLPNEACGLLAGKISEDAKTVEKVYLFTNVDQSPEHFSIDPREHLDAVRDMRARGLVPLGNFHSHPATPSRPSEEDIRLAFDASSSYLILSLSEEEPVLRAFHIENGVVSDEPIDLS